MSVSAQGIDPGGYRQRERHRTEERRVQELRNLSGPSNYNTILQAMMPYHMAAMEPGRARAADVIALGAQDQLRALDADMARRGYSGSGAHLWGRQSIRGGRQAGLGENAIRMYERALQGAIEQASGLQSLQVAAIKGTPIPQKVTYPWYLNPGGFTAASAGFSPQHFSGVGT